MLLQRIKEKIIEPNFPAVPTIYNKAMAEMNNSDVSNIVQLPQFNNIKSSLYRHRNKTAELPKISCCEAEEVEIPARYQEFLMADYRHEGVRIIIFCSKKSRELIKKVKDFFSDGTFKSCPACFKQMYVIHGDLGSDREATNIVPLMYCLMNKMTCKAYTTLFDIIKSQISEWEPLQFKTDFENAAIKAIKKSFPNTAISGCYYHYNKSIWKKAKQLGLTQRSEKIRRREIELSAVLPLLPRTELLNGWKYITRHETQDHQLLKFRSYMKKQWIKSDSLEILSVYGQRHRTNNFLEGWHNKLNKAMGKKNPNIMHFLNIIEEDASLVNVKETLIQNKIFKKRVQKSMSNDDFIQDAQLALLDEQITVGHFLEMVRT